MTLYEKTVKGTLFGSGNPMHDITNMLGLYQAGKLKLDELVTKQLHARRDQPGLPGHARRQEHPRRGHPRALTPHADLRSARGRRDGSSACAARRRCSRPRSPRAATSCSKGPPGHRQVDAAARGRRRAPGCGMEFVEGNAELTPARLVGHHDPALVLEAGYTPDTFVDGPLAHARCARAGCSTSRSSTGSPRRRSTCSSARWPRARSTCRGSGASPAAPGFRLIAAMNPFDAVGTARVSQAIADRMCRIAIGYQDERGRARDRRARDRRRRAPLAAPAVALTRGSPASTPRCGWASSVRGAIDLVRLGRGSRAARRGRARAGRRDLRRRRDRRALRPPAARGGLRADARGDRARADRAAEPKPASRRSPTAGKSAGRRPSARAGRSLSGAAARDVVRERGRRTLPRRPAGTARTRQLAAGLARRSASSTRRPSTTSCAPTPTPPSRCSPTSPRPPTRSCAPRRAGSRRGCSCAPGGSARAPRRGYRRLSPAGPAGRATSTST